MNPIHGEFKLQFPKVENNLCVFCELLHHFDNPPFPSTAILLGHHSTFYHFNRSWRLQSICSMSIQLPHSSNDIFFSQVNTHIEGSGNIKATAHSPSGEVHELLSSRLDHHSHHVNFTPDVPGMDCVSQHIKVIATDAITLSCISSTCLGQWTIAMSYEDREIDGSPFQVGVYDPARAIMRREQMSARQGEPYTFLGQSNNRPLMQDTLQTRQLQVLNYLISFSAHIAVNCEHTGVNDVTAYVIRSGETVDHSVEPLGSHDYRISFVPEEVGLYNVAVFCGGIAIPGQYPAFLILAQPI